MQLRIRDINALRCSDPSCFALRGKQLKERLQQMIEPINPHNFAHPASHYKQAVHVLAGMSWVYLSGQLGERRYGSCPDDAAGQSRIACGNVRAILAEKRFGIENVVKVTSYIVGEHNIDSHVAGHRDVVGNQKPPWTLVVVPALGRPQYLVEVDVTAAG